MASGGASSLPRQRLRRAMQGTKLGRGTTLGESGFPNRRRCMDIVWSCAPLRSSGGRAGVAPMVDEPDSDQSENMDAAKALVTNELYEAYWRSVDELGTTDLVLVRDMSMPSSRVVMTREQCLADPRTPDFLREKAMGLPNETATHTGASTASFWLAVFFPDDFIVLAVNGTRMAKGGTA